METIEVAVLMTCHNRREKTIKCLESLYQCRLPESYAFEVYLVDDGSTDGTGEAVAQRFPQVKIIQGDGELYWNKGMHLAWKTAMQDKEYHYFLWLNDDVVLFEEALAELLQVSSIQQDAIVCGTMQSRKKKKTTYGGYDENSKLMDPNGNIQRCRTFNGNLVLIPHEVCKKVGNLDPIYPHAIGDFDYAWRVKEAGFKNYVAPHYLGFCEEHISLPDWCLPTVSFLKRVKNLYSPLGNSHPYYYFIFEKRHYGYLTAIRHFLSIHLRLLMPSLWKK
jgi:GT2 family glycosyltransferase